MRIRLTSNWLRTMGLVGSAILLIGGCTSSGGASDSTGAVEITAQDGDLVDAGGDLYQANCAECHGADLRGTDKGPSHLSVVYEPNHHGDGAFILAIQRGVRAHHWPFGDMEAVEGLSGDDIAAIVAFVREQQQTHGFEPYPPP